MAETTKLSVEKALKKLRETDIRQSRISRVDEETARLDEEISRMKAQTRRLQRHQRRSNKQD